MSWPGWNPRRYGTALMSPPGGVIQMVGDVLVSESGPVVDGS
jgi:hypothetical protein